MFLKSFINDISVYIDVVYLHNFYISLVVFRNFTYICNLKNCLIQQSQERLLQKLQGCETLTKSGCFIFLK